MQTPNMHHKRHIKAVSVLVFTSTTSLKSCYILPHKTKKQTPCPESTGELYRPSGRRLSAKLVPAFAERVVSCNQCSGAPTAVISIFQTRAATFSSKQLLSCTHEAEWTPFQTRYFSENLVALGIKPGPLDL
jgi:hypothetical protein